MAGMVKRLSNLEIDEVSLVDRPANQHGLVAIAKSDQQEESMSTLFDSEGVEVFEDELEHGDTVYDEAGTEYIYTDDGDDDTGGHYEDDGEDVGKAATAYARGAMQGPKATLGRRARTRARRAGQSLGDLQEGVGDYARYNLQPRAARARRRGRAAYDSSSAQARAAGRYVNQNRGPLAAAGGVGALGGGYGGYQAGDRRERASKSLGSEVFEGLSKALTDDDRNEVISKAMDLVDEVYAQNAELTDVVSALLEDREMEDYSTLAKSYEIPADSDEIAGLLYRASQVLPEEDVAQLDRVFTAYGEVSKVAFDEVGYGGPGAAGSDVLGQVYSAADEVISKADGDISREQAVTALFAANPAAYDEYEADNRR